MKRTAAAFIAIGLAWSGEVLAQEKPNFSGRWVSVPPSTDGGAEQLVIHDLKANTLTLQHDSEGDGHKLVHKLDGTEHRNVLASHGSEIVILSKAQWTGNQLTITSVVTYPDGRRMDSKQVWSIDANGQLIIELTETLDGRTIANRGVHKNK
jgi:hypothetical protein